MASQGEGALIIADDADNVLGTRNSWFFFGESSDKRWLHDILETPGVRMIWTVNSISQLEESVARRFSFSLASNLSVVSNESTFGRPFSGITVLMLSLQRSDIDDLAAKFEVSAGVIEQSSKRRRR